MPKLIVAIVLDIDVCHEVIRVWEKAGVSGATILDSIGMRHLLAHTQRDDLPLMPSLRSLLESEEYNHRTILSVVPDDLDLEDLVRRTEAVVGNFDEADTGFLFVVPVLMARGLGRGKSAVSTAGDAKT
jgi:nitrogen regulatory protein P-II 1